MLLQKDVMFKILVYFVSLYFIINKKSIFINIVGWIILLSHIYKDIMNNFNWPIWCEYCGIILALILFYQGLKICDYFIVIIGLLKIFAHSRQLKYKDNRYYY